MAGHITQRTRTRTDGSTYSVWRARYPDPEGDDTAQIERTFARKRDADSWLTRQKGAVEQGSHVDPRKGERRVAELVDDYRATWGDLEPKTVVGYESILDHHILPRWGKTKVGAISTAAIQAWVNELSKTRQPNTIHSVYGVMRGLMRRAVLDKLIPVNPCADVTLPSKRKRVAVNGKTPRQRQLYLTAPELRTLTDALPQHWRTPTLVAGLCGLRSGELWALRRQDVDVERGTMHVAYALKDIKGRLEVGPTKTHATRTLSIPSPLIPPLKQALASPGIRVRAVRKGRPSGYPAIVDGALVYIADAPNDDAEDNRLLFTTPGGTPVQQTNFYERTFRPTVAKLWPEPHKLHGLRWHDLRHTAASLSLAASPNLHAVKERLGHEDIRTTINVYGHLVPSVDAALADALGEMWDATATPSNVVELHAKGAKGSAA